MKTIMLVGHPRRGEVAERLLGAGFFVLPADDASSALGILNALRVDGFVIDVGDASHGGERLIERLQGARAWRELPVVATGANPSQHKRLSGRGAIAEVIPGRGGGGEAVVGDVVLDAVRRAIDPRNPPRLRDDPPRRSGREGGGGDRRLHANDPPVDCRGHRPASAALLTGQ